jgi:hypothetical protein
MQTYCCSKRGLSNTGTFSNISFHVFLNSQVALHQANGLWVVCRCQSDTASWLRPLHPPAHQACKHRHYHFGLYLHQVVWESVDTHPDLPRHGNGISKSRNRLFHLILISTFLHDKTFVEYSFAWLLNILVCLQSIHTPRLTPALQLEFKMKITHPPIYTP